MRWTSLAYSFQTVRDSIVLYLSKHPLILVIIGFFVLQAIIISFVKRRRKNKYVGKFENDKNLTNNQFYITYYKKLQWIEIVRIVVIAVILGVYTLTKNFGLVSYLSIALGAFVLTFQTYIISLAVYLTIIRRHAIGDTVRFGHEHDGPQGQIIYMKPFSLAISGMTDDGQNTGQLYIIPNYLLWQKPFVKIDLKANNYSKIIISLRYNPAKTTMSFQEFLQGLEEFLSKKLPTNSATTVSHFKTYIGYKYKLDFDYDKEGRIRISIGLITRLRKAADMKRMIISHVESLRTMTHKEKINQGHKRIHDNNTKQKIQSTIIV